MSIEITVNQPNLAMSIIEALIDRAAREAQVNIDPVLEWSTNERRGHVVRIDCDSECDDRLINTMASLAIYQKMSDEIAFREFVPGRGFMPLRGANQ